LILENNQIQEVNRDHALSKIENANVKVYLISVTIPEPPTHLTDELERYLWKRENMIEPVIPDDLKGKVTTHFNVPDLETGKEIIKLIASSLK